MTEGFIGPLHIALAQASTGPVTGFDWLTVQELFFSPDRPLAYALNTLIILLAAFAISSTLRVHLQLVPREREALKKVIGLSSPSRADVEGALKGSQSILNERVQDLAAFKAQRHPVDVGAVTGLTAAAFREQLITPRGIGRSLILLGLFGTLWGLGVAVTHLAVTLSGQVFDAESLAGAILGTLGGMQTAFGTTLMGLVGTLVVGGFVGRARSAQAAVLQDIERVLATRLVPIYDSSEAGLLSEVAKSLDDVQQKLAQDLERIVSQVRMQGEALGSQLRREFDEIEAAFERRAEQLIETTGQALTSTLSVIGERHEDEPTLAEYVRSVQAVTGELDQAVRSASGLIPTLESRLLRIIEEHRSGLEKALSSHQEASTKVAAQQVEAAQALVESTKEGRKQSESLEATLAQVSQALEGARESWKRTDQVVEQVGERCYRAIEEGLRSFVNKLDQERVDTAEERARVARALTSFQGSLSSSLDQMREERSASLRMATELVESVREAVDSGVRDVGKALEGKSQDVGTEVRRAIEELSQELRELIPVRQRGRSRSGLSHDGEGGYPWGQRVPQEAQSSDGGPLESRER